MEQGLGQVVWKESVKGLVSHAKGTATLFHRQSIYRLDSNVTILDFQANHSSSSLREELSCTKGQWNPSNSREVISF